MGWLLRDGDVLAALEDRRSGWAARLDGAVVLGRPAVVHTLRCNGLDLAWCAEVDTDAGARLEVRRVVSVGGHRVARPRLARGAIVAAAPGAFERWRLRVGDQLEVRETG